MRLFLLVGLTMSAFAGNSILNRAGVAEAGMDPMQFAVIRVAAGAITLAVLLRLRGRKLPLRGGFRLAGAASLAAYMIGFSWAYLSLGAGIGALILFGVVQLVMFSWAVARRQAVPVMRWIGAVVAFAGLVLLLWPGTAIQVSIAGVASMILAGAAWATYTLLGQREPDALAATAGNFVICLPLTAIALLAGSQGDVTIAGAFLAIVAGSVTSGLGYALWYRVLPALPTTVAAIAQLSVPVIAVSAGAVLLAEDVTLRLVLAGCLVLGGIALSLIRRAA